VTEESVTITHRVPAWAKRYVATAAAQLDIPKAQVLIEALKMHRDFLVGAGIVKKGAE
jgi:hypothetical protein